MRRSAKPTASDAYQSIDRPVGAMAKHFPAASMIEAHAHPRGQLLFAASGTMTVRTEGWLWRLPPTRALWIPPHVHHAISMQSAVDMRTLYIVHDAPTPASACRAMEVTTLARELILRATELPMLYDEAGPEGMLVSLLLAELFALDGCEVPLRMPASADLLDLCRTWASRLDLRATADAWAQLLGISARTLSRRFQQETGLTFDQWRLEYLLRESHARLSLGETVLDVALALGYDSPTAFCTMFKRRFGVTPGALRRSAAVSRSTPERATRQTSTARCICGAQSIGEQGQGGAWQGGRVVDSAPARLDG